MRKLSAILVSPRSVEFTTWNLKERQHLPAACASGQDGGDRRLGHVTVAVPHSEEIVLDDDMDVTEKSTPS